MRSLPRFVYCLSLSFNFPCFFTVICPGLYLALSCSLPLTLFSWFLLPFVVPLALSSGPYPLHFPCLFLFAMSPCHLLYVPCLFLSCFTLPLVLLCLFSLSFTLPYTLPWPRHTPLLRYVICTLSGSAHSAAPFALSFFFALHFVPSLRLPGRVLCLATCRALWLPYFLPLFLLLYHSTLQFRLATSLFCLVPFLLPICPTNYFLPWPLPLLCLCLFPLAFPCILISRLASFPLRLSFHFVFSLVLLFQSVLLCFALWHVAHPLPSSFHFLMSFGRANCP